MRIKLFLIHALFVSLASCSKEEEPQVTSFQLVCKDYLTGDSLPNIEFSVRGISGGNFNFAAKTNAYGNFDTIFTHRFESDFELSVVDEYDYLLAKKSGNIIGGTNTMIELELMGLSTLQYEFDCSGSGYLQNVSHQKLVPISPDDMLYTNPNGQSIYINTVPCTLTNRYSVFSGAWIIQYDYKPHSAAPWEQVADTISINPGENYVYSIVY